MKNFIRCWSAMLLLMLGASAGIVSADDNIFPPAPAAASSISFDGRGFRIQGKRAFIASGGMEYTRIPRALWRDRLMRLKRAGFNCVEIYTFWNSHEPRSGRFDFSGDKDLGAFLKLAKSLDLYAIVRVGPYVCAEWDSGGYPVWLRFVPGLRVREDNPQFLAALDRYWEKLIPIVAENQINHGGSVILVQLENEDPQGWGRDMPNSYFTHLRDKAVALGLQVPYFFSGLHHGSDPAGNTPWSSLGRQSPWMTTEFWSVWYDHYGQTQSDVDTYDRRMWKVLAYGGNGLNFYMFHGGSNFGYTNDDEDAASYDYGAAIGQAGDLRPTYYRFKRAALFAHSFQSILEDSDDATKAYQSAATNPNIHITARKSPSGTILFLDNPTGAAAKTQVKEADGSLFPIAGTLTLTPGQIAPVIHDFPLVPGVTLERSTPLLGIQHDGNRTIIVAYGSPGDVVEMHFRASKPLTDIRSTALKRDGSRLMLTKSLRDSIDVSSFKAGGQTILILTMSNKASDHTWFADGKIIAGPDYVGDILTKNAHLSMTTEGSEYSTQTALVYSAADRPRQLSPTGSAALRDLPMRFDSPVLGTWQTLSGSEQAAPFYPDAAWKSGADPLPMGADGDNSAYAWYRSAASVPAAGTYMLRFTDGGDWASVFVNGHHAANGSIKHGVAVIMPAGTSRLAVLTAHYGRPKLYNYLGLIDTIDAKGLRGPVVLEDSRAVKTAITDWRVQTDAGANPTTPPAVTTGAGWTDGTTGPDIFHNRTGFAWYVTTLPLLSGSQHRLNFQNVDDNATVYLNGKQIGVHQGWGTAFDVSPDTAWHIGGPNTLAVLVENTQGSGGIQGAVTLQALAPGDEIAVSGWRMQGGIEEPDRLIGWKTGAGASAEGEPAYYRTTFAAAPPAETGPHRILRVTTDGLSRGFVWLNGHNLGRYPEKVPVNGLYLPEPWLKASGNELVIFDEEGRTPSKVTLTVEQAASRFVVPMTEK